MNRARSWASVSLIKVVMSWCWSSAFVNILGGGNLVNYFVSACIERRGRLGSTDGSSAMAFAERAICPIWFSIMFMVGRRGPSIADEGRG